MAGWLAGSSAEHVPRRRPSVGRSFSRSPTERGRERGRADRTLSGGIGGEGG